MKPRRGRPVRILVCAGLEPTGRMGLLADLATVHGLGAVGLGIATALTSQSPRTFHIEPVKPRVLKRQIASALSLGPPDAVKLGMVPNLGALRAVWSAIEPLGVPVLIDPVVRTSLGQPLSQLKREHYWQLAGPKVVITPNLSEAAWLLGQRRPGPNAEWALWAARALNARDFGAVVVKGGHGSRPADDALCTVSGARWVRGKRLVRSPEHRGTGCRLASALAVEWALGTSPTVALQRSKKWVERYLNSQVEFASKVKAQCG